MNGEAIQKYVYCVSCTNGREEKLKKELSAKTEDVLAALKQGMCVAVEIVNDRPMCYGQYRFVKFGSYLTNFYFPERDKKAMVEGIVAREKFLTSSNEFFGEDTFR